jgi:hypothetical protein
MSREVDEEAEALLRDAVLGPEDVAPPNRRGRPQLVVDNAKPKRRRVAAAEGFFRVFEHWFDDPRTKRRFPPATRLLLVLWWRSREGREPVRLTKRIADEARILIQHRAIYAQRLAAEGSIRLERDGRSNFAVTFLLRHV